MSQENGFVEQVAVLIPRLLYAVVQRTTNDLAQGVLTLPQFAVLDYLYAHGPCCMQTIARSLNLRPPHMTGIMDRLVKLRMTRRVANRFDRRRVMAGMTPRGQQALLQVRAQRAELLQQLGLDLSPDERNVFLTALQKLLAMIECNAESGSLEALT